MISPHPTTTQLVAEAARRERLAALAASRRHPGLVRTVCLYLVGMIAKAGIFGGRGVARNRQRIQLHATTLQAAVPDAVTSRPSSRRSRLQRRAVPELRRYRLALNITTSDDAGETGAVGNPRTDTR